MTYQLWDSLVLREGGYEILSNEMQSQRPTAPAPPTSLVIQPLACSDCDTPAGLSNPRPPTHYAVYVTILSNYPSEADELSFG